MEHFAVVRNIQNNQLYKYVGGTTYINVITGRSGEVSDDVAKRIFKINLGATDMLNKYPNVEELINRLELIISAE
jgi:DNA-binding response OmpR family regulator